MKATPGRTLGQLRIVQGIPRARVAAELGVSVGTVSGWSTGAASPKLVHAIGYARLLRRRVIAVRGFEILAEGEQLADLIRLRNLAGASRVQVARRLGISPTAVKATEMRYHAGAPLATCTRYLEASGYRVGFGPIPTAPAWEPANPVGHATLARYLAMEELGYGPARMRYELGLSTRQFQRYAATADARREKQLQEAS